MCRHHFRLGMLKAFLITSHGSESLVMVDILRLELFCPHDHQQREAWDDTEGADNGCGGK